MPDPTRKTISGTEASVLLNRSPYSTRYLLYHGFRDGIEAPRQETERMRFGKILEPYVLTQTAEDRGLDIEPMDEYVRERDGLFGTTKDARCVHPQFGPMTVEVKCVFDYRVWMTRWNGGARPPDDLIIQVQTQMKVGDGDGKPYKHGLIAVWLCAEMTYFEIEPMPELWDTLDAEAKSFFEEVKAGEPPEPLGHPIEIPIINQIYPIVEDKTIELLGDADLAEVAAMYHWADGDYKLRASVRDQSKAKLLAAATDAKTLLVDGHRVTVKKSHRKAGLDEIPSDVRADLSKIENLCFKHKSRAAGFGEISGRIRNLLEAERPIKRRASISSSITVEEIQTQSPEPDTLGTIDI